MSARTKYDSLLAALPHMVGERNLRIMSISALGKLAGLKEDRIYQDIMANCGRPPLSSAEVGRAINKVFSSTASYSPTAGGYYSRKTESKTGETKAFVGAGTMRQMIDFPLVSPVPIPRDPVRQYTTWLRSLWGLDAFVFVGERYDNEVFEVREILDAYREGETRIFVHAACNAYTGKQGMTQTGTPSYRAKTCIAERKYALIEFDALPLDEQCLFWSAYLDKQKANGASVPGRLASLVYSGGKSIHGLIDITDRKAGRLINRTDCSKPWEDTWAEIMERFSSEADPQKFRCDPACKDESRLTRAAGAFRIDKNKVQTLLYLDA